MAQLAPAAQGPRASHCMVLRCLAYRQLAAKLRSGREHQTGVTWALEHNSTPITFSKGTVGVGKVAMYTPFPGSDNSPLMGLLSLIQSRRTRRAPYLRMLALHASQVTGSYSAPPIIQHPQDSGVSGVVDIVIDCWLNAPFEQLGA